MKKCPFRKKKVVKISTGKGDHTDHTDGTHDEEFCDCIGSSCMAWNDSGLSHPCIRLRGNEK